MVAIVSHVLLCSLFALLTPVPPPGPGSSRRRPSLWFVAGLALMSRVPAAHAVFCPADKAGLKNALLACVSEDTYAAEDASAGVGNCPTMSAADAPAGCQCEVGTNYGPVPDWDTSKVTSFKQRE